MHPIISLNLPNYEINKLASCLFTAALAPGMLPSGPAHFTDPFDDQRFNENGWATIELKLSPSDNILFKGRSITSLQVRFLYF